jgi:hypothetical protein
MSEAWQRRVWLGSSAPHDLGRNGRDDRLLMPPQRRPLSPRAAQSRSPVGALYAARTGLRALSGRAPGVPLVPEPSRSGVSRHPSSTHFLRAPSSVFEVPPQVADRGPPSDTIWVEPSAHESRIDARPSDFSVRWCDANFHS